MLASNGSKSSSNRDGMVAGHIQIGRSVISSRYRRLASSLVISMGGFVLFIDP